jgi:murein DD-endopeptidase MepM/ murein hydrolase activator NlpD
MTLRLRLRLRLRLPLQLRLRPLIAASAIAATLACTVASMHDDGQDEAIVRELQARQLEVPVAGVTREQLVPSFRDPRTGHSHEALDIPAPRGTPVIAVEDGTIEKLFLSKPGGNTIYQFDPSRRFAYYYAHLDRYADGLKEHQAVRRRDVIGYVGSTGNASDTNPHLHFGIFVLTSKQQWWKGKPVDPYRVLRGEPARVSAGRTGR